jgi:hypothetical protein
VSALSSERDSNPSSRPRHCRQVTAELARRGSKVTVAVFWGRERYVSILWRYLERNLVANQGIISEVRLSRVEAKSHGSTPRCCRRIVCVVVRSCVRDVLCSVVARMGVPRMECGGGGKGRGFCCTTLFDGRLIMLCHPTAAADYQEP